MTWWQWIMLFLAICLWPLSVMATVVITAKIVKGEPLTLKQAPPPKPKYSDPVQANRIIAERKREQDERSANFRG